MTGVFIRMENLDRDTYRGKRMYRHREKTAIHKPKREGWNRFCLAALRKDQPCQRLISDF